MSKPNYASAFARELGPNKENQNVPHYSDGTSFLAYKNLGGGRMTSYNSNQSISGLKQQMNLPTDNTLFRNGMQADSIGLGNESLKNWVYSTQTLASPSIDNMFCTSKSDCQQFSDKHECNSNYQPWNDAYGNQSGSVCSYTEYPELKDGTYNRKLVTEGGIGKQCFTDNECNTGAGYYCNNETDIFGTNIQQNGFCAQKYTCPDSKVRFLGTPYNSAIPISPSPSQNKNGQGYDSELECKSEAMAQQNCVNNNGKWYAVFPGYCPTEAVLRAEPTKGTGALRFSGLKQLETGFVIPGFAMSLNSTMGSEKSSQSGPVGAFLYNRKNEHTGLLEPTMYQQSINPRP